VAGHVLDDESLDWRALAGARQTVVFYMGVSHLDGIATKLRANGASADHPAAIIERATLPEQRTVRGTLSTIADLAREAKVSAPALLIVGDVTAFNASEVLTGNARTDGAKSHGAFV
jgi:uroporphyrin-III C-methyltransferase